MNPLQPNTSASSNQKPVNRNSPCYTESMGPEINACVLRVRGNDNLKIKKGFQKMAKRRTVFTPLPNRRDLRENQGTQV